MDPGFDPENLLTVQIELPEASYPSDEDVVHFYREALNRMAVSPGIDAAAAATRLPLSRFAATATTRVLIEDRPELDEGDEVHRLTTSINQMSPKSSSHVK